MKALVGGEGVGESGEDDEEEGEEEDGEGDESCVLSLFQEIQDRRH